VHKKREFVTGAFYHVTSRTNDKIKVFENNLGRKIMLITLQNAKDRFHFRLTNFCVMPTHIHLLIQPAESTSLSVIMQWIKIQSAKWWNTVHGSTDHLWGSRYFARAVKDPQEYEFVMNYIDQNPVVVGLAATPEEWKASAAFYKSRNIPGLADYPPNASPKEIKLLPLIPYVVSKLIPPAQLEHIKRYIGAYAVALDRLFDTIPTIPKIGKHQPPSASGIPEPHTYLHYCTNTHDYYISEYDGEDTMHGKVRSNAYPAETKWQKLALSGLKKNQFLKLELSPSIFPPIPNPVNHSPPSPLP
jgi:putative transposase